jgi:hypothetical protein
VISTQPGAVQVLAGHSGGASTARLGPCPQDVPRDLCPASGRIYALIGMVRRVGGRGGWMCGDVRSDRWRRGGRACPCEQTDRLGGAAAAADRAPSQHQFGAVPARDDAADLGRRDPFHRDRSSAYFARKDGPHPRRSSTHIRRTARDPRFRGVHSPRFRSGKHRQDPKTKCSMIAARAVVSSRPGLSRGPLAARGRRGQSSNGRR